MEIKKAHLSQIDDLMVMYDQAREFMKANGNPTQWVAGYPGKELLTADIMQEHLYVCTENDAILAVFAFIMGDDPTYAVIKDGAWKNDLPYGVVHRICTARHGGGIGAYCLNWCFEQAGGNLRIDTHENNRPMQALLTKNGFTYCGKIYLKNGSERFAFQKTK